MFITPIQPTNNIGEQFAPVNKEGQQAEGAEMETVNKVSGGDIHDELPGQGLPIPAEGVTGEEPQVQVPLIPAEHCAPGYSPDELWRALRQTS